MVDYNKKKRLDTSRVRDRRGRSGGGRSSGSGGGFPGLGGGGGSGGKGVAAGGVGAIVLVIIALLSGADPSELLGGGEPAADQGQPPADGGLNACETGADIATNRDCRFVAFENSIQDFWEDEFATDGSTYPFATLTTFTGAVSTGCGQASSAVGPFYCPPDQGVFLDLGFFDTLETQLGARGGDFAEAYVLAHEVGHHVQNITGQMDRVQSRQGDGSDAVRLELQADCLAGMWAGRATQPGPNGEAPYFDEITQDDIDRALDAAAAVGDDYIQSRTQGTVTPETWTHGSAAQRGKWFRVGFSEGDFGACDTFTATNL